jgi:hypothetical protein
MKKQYVSLLVLGISILLTTGALAQNTSGSRRIDQQVSAAKSQGLFKQTYTPFTAEQGATRHVAEQVVSDATYLQMQPDQTLRIFRERPGALTLSIPLVSGQPLEMELVQQSPLAHDFFVSTNTSDGKPVAYTPGVYYRGTLKGVPGSTVAISVFEDEIIGVAATPDKGNLVLGKLQTANNTTGYILYSDKNLETPPMTGCGTEEPLGYTEKMREYMAAENKPTADKCVRVYLECDYALRQNKGSVTGATNFITAVFNNLAVLYANESITTIISQVFVWNTQDSYPTTSSSNALNSFRTTRPTFNGDIAHLAALGGANVGGIAWVDILCNSSYRYAYSNIYSSYNTVPTYSWSVYVMTHEMGHNLGSPHTQSCSWTGGALDNCYTTEGGCAAGPAPVNGGTIMSYCHLTSYGINFNNGFGTQPGNLIRNRVTAASCLTSCTSGPGCTTNSATLTIILDNYPEECSWNIKNSSNVIVASGGTYGSSPDGATITANLCLPNGCYTLTMLDSYGDGICCSYGNGSYSLKNNATNVILASGGQYGTQDVKTFCFTGGTPPQGGTPATSSLAAEDFKVYPNPASDMLHIRWSSELAGTATLLLTDLAGRKIATYKVNGSQGKNNFDLPLNQLPSGMYLLKLDAGGKQFQQKVMVQQP